MMNIAQIISERLNIALGQVEGTLKLLADGATVPFIARYRKEATGSLDEVAITAIKEQWEQLTALQARKETVLATIEGQGRLTPQLAQRIEQCTSPVELEDIYLPFRPKRRTRASVARERGLEPLARLLMEQTVADPAAEAGRYVGEQVPDAQAALDGACDIIAEQMAEDEATRNSVRRHLGRTGRVATRVVKGMEETGVKFSDYFEASGDPVSRVSSHRFLAMMRGVDEGVLRIGIEADSEPLLGQLGRRYIRRGSTTAPYIERALADGYKRLLQPSIENETLSQIKERADETAIAVFADNLRQLLLSSPLGQKRVLAIDPGFRTGCKVVALDSQGNLLHHTAIYPHPPQRQMAAAADTLFDLAQRYDLQAIAVGSGTAGRETEQFIRTIGLDKKLQLFTVNEDGASVYSASDVAREEFPDCDITVRGAVSIGRRLMDPLSELVKIEPRSIGVGQYQHSVDQKKLKTKLDAVVESCVNLVGVNLNTATRQILTYVSGLGPSLAQNIVDYRAQNGDFRSRRDLLKVPRLGAKAYEQAAGFLRVLNGDNPLDSTAVHPESYGVVERMARDAGLPLPQFIASKEARRAVDPQKYVTPQTGLPTVVDILEALDKRGLDPRSPLKTFAFDESVHQIEDLRVGMVLPGIVSNITAFGAFVNIGVHQDGLVHISQMCDRYIKSPSQAVSLGQQVRVRILEVDLRRRRISLSMKEA